MIYDIIIYGEFDAVVRAFKFVAMMFSPATGYIGLIGAVGMAVILFGTLSAVSGHFFGKGNIMSWFYNVVIASVIIISTISIKCQVIIHDKTLNKVETIGDVPAFMGLLAYLQNSISNTTKDIVTTIMSPIVEYDLIGKGQGYELLASLDDVGKEFSIKNPQAVESMGNYIQHCVIPDMTYSWIDPKAFNAPINSDIWGALKSETMTRFSTVVTIDASGKRIARPLPCAESYVEISKLISDYEVQLSLSKKCAKNMGEGANEQTACKDAVTGLFGQLIAPGINRNVVLRNYIVARVYMGKHGMLNSMLNDMNKRNIAGSFMAEKTLPRLKSMMFGIVISLFPFLVAFIWINPSKTIIFYAGLFLMLALWNAIDTVFDMQYQNEVYNAFASLRRDGLGLNQMFDIPNMAADAVSLYGQGRWAALGLASLITTAITGVSAYALSAVGNQLTSTAQGAGATGSQYADTAGQGRLMEKANIDAGMREVLSQSTMANWQGIAHGEAQRHLTNMDTGNTMYNALGNAGTAAYNSSNTLDKTLSSHGGFAGDKAMAQATGQNLEQYSQWSKEGKIIDQNIANSLVTRGVPEAVAQNSIGLSMTSGGVDANGNISNFSAKGIDANGQDKSISMAENVARFQVQGGTQNIAGFDIDNGGSVTVKYNPDGSVAQLGVEGAGYTRFSHNAQDGFTSGTHAFEKNGINYTQDYKGNTRTTSFMDKTGDTLFRQESRGEDGKYHAYKTDIAVGSSGYNLDGIHMQEGSNLTQGNEGVTTASGVFNIGNREFNGTITTNAAGDIVSMQGRNGQNLSQEDVDNYNRERIHSDKTANIKSTLYQDTREVSEGSTVKVTDLHDYNGKAIAQSIAGGRGDKALGNVQEIYAIMDNNVDRRYADHKESYDRALTAWCMAAADGLSGVVAVKDVSTHENSKSQNISNSKTAEADGGFSGKIDIGNDNLGLSIGGGGKVKYSEEEKSSQSETRSSALQVTKNELYSRIKDITDSGIRNGDSQEQILKNINENVMLKK